MVQWHRICSSWLLDYRRWEQLWHRSMYLMSHCKVMVVSPIMNNVLGPSYLLWWAALSHQVFRGQRFGITLDMLLPVGSWVFLQSSTEHQKSRGYCSRCCSLWFVPELWQEGKRTVFTKTYRRTYIQAKVRRRPSQMSSA